MKNFLLYTLLIYIGQLNAQIITTIAGNGTAGYNGDGGQAMAAEFNTPSKVVFDAFGNMYIIDRANSRIRIVNTSGVISTIAGNGTAGYSGDGGQATDAALSNPIAIAFDTQGNFYIADCNNYRVRKVNTSGIITTTAGNGMSSYTGDGGQATAAAIGEPYGLTFDGAGNLYICDILDQNIRKVNTAGIITTIVGNGNAGFSGDGGQATAAELRGPTEIMFANDNLYIVDTDNNRIRLVNSSGIITTVAGIGWLGGTCNCGYSGDGGQATNAELNYPFGITMDGSGNIYIADFDNNRIRMVNNLGIISTIVGNGTAGFSGDGGQATTAELDWPRGISFDAFGNLYIADEKNNRIRMVTNVGQMNISQIAGIDNQVVVYPNPNNGIFIIETRVTKKQDVLLYDVSGKLVLRQTISGKTNIDASILNEGLYNMSIISDEGVLNKRLVIVR